MSQVAAVYAKSFYLVLESISNGALESAVTEAQKNLDYFQKLLVENKKLQKALVSPATTAEERKGILNAIGKKTGFSMLVIRLLTLLAQKNRLNFVPAIAIELEKIKIKKENGVFGEVVSSDPLSDQETKDLVAAFEKKLKRPLSFRVSVDPELLAGLKVTIDGVTYDGSLKGKLEQLGEKFLAQSNLIH